METLHAGMRWVPVPHSLEPILLLSLGLWCAEQGNHLFKATSCIPQQPCKTYREPPFLGSWNGFASKLICSVAPKKKQSREVTRETLGRVLQMCTELRTSHNKPISSAGPVSMATKQNKNKALTPKFISGHVLGFYHSRGVFPSAARWGSQGRRFWFKCQHKHQNIYRQPS